MEYDERIENLFNEMKKEYIDSKIDHDIAYNDMIKLKKMTEEDKDYGKVSSNLRCHLDYWNEEYSSYQTDFELLEDLLTEKNKDRKKSHAIILDYMKKVDEDYDLKRDHTTS